MTIQKKHLISTAVVALVIGVGIGYAGAGMFAAPAVPKAARGGFAGSGMMRSGGSGGGFLTGTVAAKDSGSITLNTRDGSSHVILVTPATTVSKSVNGTESDVTLGATIIVSGATNSDGSLSASLIQLRPDTPPTAQ
ncbi:MAG: hypothetical protein ACHQU0_02650 [Candidatus Paceibacteria bacterium]